MNKTYILLLILVFISFAQLPVANGMQNCNKSNDTLRLSKENHGYLEIQKENGEHYDDGVFKTKFAPYSIFDSDSTLVLKISEAVAKPVKVRIEPGTYYIRFKTTKTVYEVTVNSGITSEYIIPQS